MLPKRETIIPFLHPFLMLPLPRFLQRPEDLLLRKAERGGVLVGGGGDYLQVVQLREDGFLGDPGDACDQTSLHVGVVLEGVHEEAFEEGDDLVPEMAQPGFQHGCVILVKEDDGLFPIIPLQVPAEPPERRLSRPVRHVVPHGPEEGPVVLIEQIRFHDVFMHLVDVSEQLLDRVLHRFRVVRPLLLVIPSAVKGLHPREAQEYHRICALQRPETFLLPDLPSLKQVSPALVPIGEKALYRAHVQCLAEPARTRDQGDAVPLIPPLPDEIRLINIEYMVTHHVPIILVTKSMPHFCACFHLQSSLLGSYHYFTIFPVFRQYLSSFPSWNRMPK